MVEGEDCVGPVEVWCDDELEEVTPAEVDLITVLYLLGFEVKVHEVSEEIEADLGAEDGGVGGELDDVGHQP